MKTGRKIIILLIVLLLAVVALISLNRDSDETYSAELYFINETGTSIFLEKRDVKFDDKNDLPYRVMTELSMGTLNSEIDVIPDGASWYISRKGSHLMVDFSGEFLTEDGTKNILSAYAVVKSLCGIDGVAAVKVTVRGEELSTPDGTTIGYLTKNDIDIEEENAALEKRVKLYFYSELGMLSEEWRSVKITDTAPIAEYLIAELIKGPKEEGYQRAISSETKLISVEVTEGIAYVNLQKNFIEKNKGDSRKEWAAVYSIVNTLLDLSEIDGVQFLFDGKKDQGFESIDLSGLFTRE